jgi:hypothetical protein
MFSLTIMLIGISLPENNLPDPEAAPQAPALTSIFKESVRGTRKVVARRLINLGRSIDPEALLEAAPNKGYIKKALDKSREQLKDKDDQRTELQRFYESEIHRMSHLLSEEENMMREVFSEDFDGTVDSSKLNTFFS